MSVAKILRLIVTPILLIAMVGFCWYAANWGWAAWNTPIPKRVASCQPKDVGGELTTADVVVRVYNGGETGGLAKQTAMYLRAFGFPAPKYNNTTEKVTTTIVVGHAADDPEVQLVMGFFPGAVNRPDGRADHSVDVLIGSAFKRNEKPKTSLKVDGPVCLPVIATTATATAATSTSTSTAKAKATATKSAKK
ncbi:MAG: LytR C-terminal domain-containing protein [Propionibacteriaceae bacterium]|jgi:hypothetical protein|nr:LytR C-terminal domain-containing protein [Propionibacteriaceae bacterium]